MREPDETGAGNWKAWRSRFSDHKNYPANLDLWLLYCPGAHLAWDYHSVTVVHLRPIPNYPPPQLTRPDISHEFGCIAINRQGGTPDPDLPPWNFLTPPNWIHQVSGITDDTAKQIAFLIVKQIMTGQVSPDSDFRSYWAETINNTVQHYVKGLHGVA